MGMIRSKVEFDRELAPDHFTLGNSPFIFKTVDGKNKWVNVEQPKAEVVTLTLEEILAEIQDPPKTETSK